MLPQDVGAQLFRLLCPPAARSVPRLAAPCRVQLLLAGRGGCDPHVRRRGLRGVPTHSALHLRRGLRAGGRAQSITGPPRERRS
eukprot:10301176-Alexandrium_andersonii.AAC.1